MLEQPAPQPPQFAPLAASEDSQKAFELRKVMVPHNRVSPIKREWNSTHATPCHQRDVRALQKSRKRELNPRPLHYKCSALPLSYPGVPARRFYA